MITEGVKGLVQPEYIQTTLSPKTRQCRNQHSELSNYSDTQFKHMEGVPMKEKLYAR